MKETVNFKTEWRKRLEGKQENIVKNLEEIKDIVVQRCQGKLQGKGRVISIRVLEN